MAGDAALYFSPTDPAGLAARLLEVQNPALTADLRQRGHDRIQAFSFARCASRTAAVMNGLLH